MVKTQKRGNGVRRTIKRIKRSTQACLGVLCATLLLVAALPTASDAVGEETQAGSDQQNPAPIAAPMEYGEGVSADEPSTPPAPDAEPETLVEADLPAQGEEAEIPDKDENAGGDESIVDVVDEGAQGGSEALDSSSTEEADSYETEPSTPQAVESNALAAAPLAADPPGFSWTFAGIDDNTCKITGYTGGTIPSGTVHVPATNPATNKKVVAIEGGFTKYQNLKCGIDFSQAVNLERIETQAFAGSGLTGALDFSKCAKLTAIGSYAFKDASGVTGVVLPPNLRSIGNYAFMGDGGIGGSLSLPKTLGDLGLQAFDGCKLTSLAIPSETALSSIPSRAFADNRIAGPLVFPASINTVGSSAFVNSRITAVTFQAGSVSLGSSAFQNNLIANDPISGKVFSTLGAYAFAGNRLSGEISFAKNTTPIPAAGIIADNPGVTKVVLSQSWIVVPDEMFKGLTSLIDVSVPEGNTLHRVGNRAFQGCTSLRSFNFNNAPLLDSTSNGNAIGQQAFQGCSSLETVYMGTGVFGSSSVITITLSASAFKDCTALSYIDIPEPTSGVTKLNVKIGDKAFMNTNLGAFPNPLDPSKPLGYLPLDRRTVISIGASAFENAQLSGVKLPDSLQSVGARAFAGNHMAGLELPRNANLDKPGSVGTDILAGQTVDEPAVWGDSAAGGPGKADIILEALHALGLVHDRVDAVGLNVPGVGSNVQPDNAATWKQDHVATYDKALVETAGSTFTYGYEIWRTGGSGPLSHGTATLQSVDKGVPFEFNYYGDEGFSDLIGTHVQWVGVGHTPVEEMHGIANFGLNKPGYRTQPGAYDAVANAGWRTGPGPGGTGSPVDPETLTAVDGDKPEFYNRWIANSYDVEFDDNWEFMVAQDPKLGKAGPDGATVPDEAWVSGTTTGLAGLTYGRPAALPENGFAMGGYAFAGWATSPDLPEGDRTEGSNFFSPGASIATPDPAPVEGGTVTLYAQWKAVDLGADDPALLGFLSIPQHISLEPSGNRLYSEPTSPDGGPDDHAVTVSAEAEAPGATWPSDQVYQVSVTRPSANAPLLALSGDGDAKVIEVQTLDGGVYDPGVNDADNPGAVPSPLMTIDPSDGAKKAGSFMLASIDPVSVFKPNVRYAGTMTFRVDIVQKGVTP